MLKPAKELTEEEIWALQVNYDEAQQWLEEIAQNLMDLMPRLGGYYYRPPRHDPNCIFCKTSQALDALKYYFEIDRVYLDELKSKAELARRQLMVPTIGRIIIYRSRTGDYDCAAIISATRATLNVKNVEAGYIPNITDETNVHLTVFSAGKPGQGRTIANAEGDFLVKSEHGYSVNTSGTYQEWDVAFDPDGGPCTWRWPDRV